jgi:hypothetical protein
VWGRAYKRAAHFFFSPRRFTAAKSSALAIIILRLKLRLLSKIQDILFDKRDDGRPPLNSKNQSEQVCRSPCS